MPILQSAEELETTNPIYDELIDQWLFWGACYEGVNGLKRINHFKKHPRETPGNYKKRIDGLYSFNYCGTVVDTINHYLFKANFIRQFSALDDDELFQLFKADADLEGTDYDALMKQNDRDASIYGYVGVLVDKPNVEAANMQDAINKQIYPYAATYLPQNILDWSFTIDPASGRPVLSFVKLRDTDGNIRVWNRTEWEVWELTDPENGQEHETPFIVSSGENELGEVPMVLHYNEKHPVYRRLGQSMIKDVSHIDLSITKNLSDMEEVIELASFPMMRKPKQQVTAKDENQDIVGPDAVLVFDPENPDSKPDWLNSEVQGPISAVLDVIVKKEDAIYRITSTGGILSSNSREIPSGDALSFLFSRLEASMAKKGDNTVEAERGILRLWLKWQDKEGVAKEIQVEAPDSYAVEALAQRLQDILTATAFVNSETYTKAARKSVAQTAFKLTNDDEKQVIEEIDDAQPPIEPDDVNPDGM